MDKVYNNSKKINIIYILTIYYIFWMVKAYNNSKILIVTY